MQLPTDWMNDWIEWSEVMKWKERCCVYSVKGWKTLETFPLVFIHFTYITATATNNNNNNEQLNK